MGYKVTGMLLLDIVSALEDANTAVNRLERSSANSILYPELKVRLQGLIDRLNSQYGLRELLDPDDRNNNLNKIRDEALKADVNDYRPERST